MKSVQIQFRGLNSIKSFVNILSHYDNDFDIVDQRYVIDAKSIMGLFSLDLTHPVELRVMTENEEVINKVVQELDDYSYIVK